MWPLLQFFCFGLLINSIQISTSQNLVSSPINIDDFLQKEPDMMSKIQDYLIQERERLDQLKTYLKDWTKWRNSTFNQESDYISFPQNLFHLFKKVTRDFNELENTMIEPKYNNSMDLDDIEPPTEDHIKKIILSMVDLQYQYNLKSEHIMNGTLMDLQTNISISPESCFFIAKTCSEQNNHQCAVDWLETCLSSSPDQQFTLQVYNLTYPSYLFLNQSENAFEHARNYLAYDFYDRPALNTYMDLGQQLGELDDEDENTLEAYRLCREHSPNPTHADLKCRYNHENSAFLKIAPLKEEELYQYPKVLLYRDIIYDSEIEIIKEEATKELGVSLLAGANGTASKKGFVFRISETAFINNKSPNLSQLTERVVDISDMSIESSEWWQVLNYAPGGFYMMHSDYLNPGSPSVIQMGNRLTTMLFYFNEIVQGGETVFPRIGVSVKPAKGLVVVWHNVHSDGSQNLLTDHSACPVVIGEKWGFTQWIRGFNQTCLRRIYEHEPVILRKTENNSTQSPLQNMEEENEN